MLVHSYYELTFERRNMAESVKGESGKRICVVGLGYVGLPTAVAFHEAGFDVVGVDVSEATISKIEGGENPLIDGSSELKIPLNSKTWMVTTDFGRAIPDSDVILITVPTPVNEDNSPDLSYVRSASSSVLKNIDKNKNTIVVLESTVYPGVTREILGGICDDLEIKQGIEATLAYCPERVNPGDAARGIESVAQIVGCDNKEIGEYLAGIFGKITQESSTYVGKIEVAEASKLIENVQRDIDIALSNELAMVLPKMGIDVEDVLAAAATKWNFHRHSPGIGVGGHCIPVDPYFYISMAEEVGFPSLLSSSARKLNNSMPVNSAKEILSKIDFKEGKRVLVLGYSYKAEVGDTRETPVEYMVNFLVGNGCEVIVWDPYVEDEEFPRGIEFGKDPYAVENIDIIVVATGHSKVINLEWARIKSQFSGIPIIYDGRRVLEKNLFEAMGWKFCGIGVPE